MAHFQVPTRDELQDDYRVFYVTAWGYAADHLFGWVPKALNTHREIFALLAHEGSRPKYFAERTRAERPELVPYTEFLNDMGMTYAAIGDCYSYRAGQMPALLGQQRYKAIPVANLVRHPVPWLEFYTRWRASNMRMRAGVSDPLLWEWKTSCHAYFASLGLRPYTKDEVEVWASFQGMFQLNNILGDIGAVDLHLPVEAVADAPEVFAKLVTFLTRGTVAYDQADLDRAYAMRHTPFRGERDIETDPAALLGGWPGWKADAFRKLLTDPALDAYESLGYDLTALRQRPVAVAAQIMEGEAKPYPQLSRPLFVSSVPKSGTWLLRELLQLMTGLTPHEPVISAGRPDYEDENLIEIPAGSFFSWHSVLTPRSISLLRSSQSKCILLVRNIYDVLLAMLNHLVNDVDASIGRSVGSAGYFADKTLEQRLAMMISGFTSPRLTWHGAGELLRQMDSMMDMLETGYALLVSYENLVANKAEEVARIARYLGLPLEQERLDEIVRLTDKEAMRARKALLGQEKHITPDREKLRRDCYSEYHWHMLDFAIMQHAPRLWERLIKFGYTDALKR